MWNLIGSTIWARQTLESDIFYKKPDKWFKIWFFLVNRVNHKDNKQFKRGECFTTYAEISQYTEATQNQVDHCMRWLKSATMIATQKTTRGMIIFVLNYAKFQDAIKSKSDTKSDTIGETEAKQKRNRSDTIKKNGNNGKNGNNVNTSQATPAGQISELVKEFEKINPTINYGNKTQRKALEEMIKKFGFEKLRGTIRFAISIQGKPYSPVITTPWQLKENMGKLLIYYKKENFKKPLSI